jgi:hypothetical protein
MSQQLELIIALENELLGLVVNGHLPTQVEQQIEQACLTMMKARSLMQFCVEKEDQLENSEGFCN